MQVRPPERADWSAPRLRALSESGAIAGAITPNADESGHSTFSSTFPEFPGSLAVGPNS